MKAAVFCSILVGLALFGCDNRQSSGRQESGATLCDAQGVPVSFLVVYSQSNEPKTFFDRLSFGVDPASSVTTQTHHSLGLLPVPPQGTDHAEFVFCLSRLPASESLSKLAEHGFSDDFSETLKTILDKIGTIDESDGLAKAVLVGSSGNLHWSAYLYSRQKTNKYALTCHLSDRRQAYRFFKRCSRDESSELEKLYQFCAARLSLENDKSIKLEPGEIDFGEVTEIERTVLTATLRDYLDQFFAELPPLPSSNPTNSVVWSAPQLITMPDGQSFNVGQSAEDGNPIFESFQISSDNGITNGEFRIYRVPTSIHSYCIVESALSLPRSIPARAFASLFNAEAETNGVYCIVPKSALPGIPGFLLLYENMGIGLFWNGGNQKNLALALLRAGGVDIPDDPPRSSPAPESFQAMRVFSSDSEEPSDSPPPAPKPAFQAMRIFSSEPESEPSSPAQDSESPPDE